MVKNYELGEVKKYEPREGRALQLEGTSQRLWLKVLEFTEGGMGECVAGAMPRLSTNSRKPLTTALEV